MGKVRDLKPEQVKNLLRELHSHIQVFEQMFPHGKACKERLREWKWPQGFKCDICCHEEHYYNSSKHRYECKSCRHQHSFMTGTIFHRTRTPLKVWFYIIYVMGLTDRRIIPRAHFLSYLDEFKPGVNNYKALNRIITIISEMDEESFNSHLELVCYYDE